jgi:phage N-6-adenine-methyltransferase
MDIHYSSNKTEWETPQDLFDKLNYEFGFTLDVCATDENTKCPNWYTKEDDGLNQPWSGTCWMNPPYGREIGKWLAKAWQEHLLGAVVVCLVPSGTDTKWWHTYCMKGEVRFIEGRLKFSGNKWNAPFPNAIVIFKS